MSSIYLKFPTQEDKENWINYLEEYISYTPDAEPLGCGLDFNYEEWLQKVTNERKGINLKNNRVPGTVYFLINNGRIVGHTCIRHSLGNDYLSTYGGNIGLGVRPSERKNGYATKMLELALVKCKELGLDKVMITCREDNIGSARTIEKNGGILEDIVFIEEQDANYKKYWIDI